MTDDRLAGNAIATVALAVTLFPLVGAGAWLLQAVIGGTALPLRTVVLVALVSGSLLAVLAIVVTTVTTYAAYRFELDPDDVVIPARHELCDVLGVVVLFVPSRCSCRATASTLRYALSNTATAARQPPS